MKLYPAAFAFALLASGCPQLLDDDFHLGDGLIASGGASPQASAGAGNDGGSNQSAGGTAAGSAGEGAGGTAPAALCAGGTQLGPGGVCYVVSSSTESWQTARENCQAEGPGWDLATVRSSADTEFIIPMLDDELWIGASDAEQEGRWLWIATGDAFWPEAADGGTESGAAAYTNWNAGEPNNVDGADCLRLLSSGKWADLPCDEERGALCAGPPN
jgi:hypothetical protein